MRIHQYLRLPVIICSMLLVFTISGCSNNNTVEEVTPQSEKVDYFKNFDEEKNFMINQAFEAVKKTGEEPEFWYTDNADFSKSNDYSAYSGAIKCKDGKLAHVHIQYDMQDTADLNEDLVRMSDDEISQLPEGRVYDITHYKSIPRVYSADATISENYLDD